MGGQCVGCELESLRSQLKLVQSHAKAALDKLPERWNLGFQSGLKQAIPYEKELLTALAAEKRARQDDNATFTTEIMRLEEEGVVKTQQIEKLVATIDQLTIERDEAKKTGGYTCHVCGALRAECEIMRRTRDDVARRAADVAGSQDAIGKTPAQVAAAILREFGLSE